MEGAVTADGFQNPAYMINDQGVDNFAVNGVNVFNFVFSGCLFNI